MARKYEIVYRYCGDHNHVEKGRRFPDGQVVITDPDWARQAHDADDVPSPETPEHMIEI